MAVAGEDLGQVRKVVTPLTSAAIGGVAGIVEVSIQQPSVAWKNAIQDNRPVSLNPRMLYRGYLVNAGSIAPINAIQFGANTFFERFFERHGLVSDGSKAAGAGAAGAVSGILSGPAELLMIQQQKHGGSLVSRASQLARQHGLLCFARGLTPTLVREGVYTSAYLGVNPILCKKLLCWQPDLFEGRHVAAMMTSSVISGITAGVLTQPIDTVKTRMQANLGNPLYRTVSSTGWAMWQEGGVRALWKGLLPRTLRLTGCVFILGECQTHLTNAYLSFTNDAKTETETGEEELLQ